MTLCDTIATRISMHRFGGARGSGVQRLSVPIYRMALYGIATRYLKCIGYTRVPFSKQRIFCTDTNAIRYRVTKAFLSTAPNQQAIAYFLDEGIAILKLFQMHLHGFRISDRWTEMKPCWSRGKHASECNSQLQKNSICETTGEWRNR